MFFNKIKGGSLLVENPKGKYRPYVLSKNPGASHEVVESFLSSNFFFLVYHCFLIHFQNTVTTYYNLWSTAHWKRGLKKFTLLFFLICLLMKILRRTRGRCLATFQLPKSNRIVPDSYLRYGSRFLRDIFVERRSEKKWIIGNGSLIFQWSIYRLLWACHTSFFFQTNSRSLCGGSIFLKKIPYMILQGGLIKPAEKWPLK